VVASDFGSYTANGNVAQTLNSNLSQHIIRLNKIRMAVPALRKGQYTFDGCKASGGYAFKRAYKDSYALVAINGGATFTGVPAGTYVDLVTGQSYESTGTITVSAPTNKGQLRVLVKDWKGGKVGEDGNFIYTTSAVSTGNAPTFSDPGASFFYTADDAIGSPSVKLSVAGGSFKTETLTITATLNEAAESGWVKVGNDPQVVLSKGQDFTFTIGGNMNYDESVTVTWSAKGDDGKSIEGKAVYTKKDPNSLTTVYYDNSLTQWKDVKIYYWPEESPKWPGVDMTNVSGDIWSFSVPQGTTGIIFNGGGNGNLQTNDLTGFLPDHVYQGKPNGNAQCNIDDLGVYGASGVSLSPADDSEVIYFNLQGVRVSEPVSGIYLRKQGNKVMKVIVK
ncbi:MAG: starch-binding protein, partial [Muribaculaceae bacterium]|nr:starch-binding protein [Muribaculaceae bacterium]